VRKGWVEPLDCLRVFGSTMKATSAHSWKLPKQHMLEDALNLSQPPRTWNSISRSVGLPQTVRGQLNLSMPLGQELSFALSGSDT